MSNANLYWSLLSTASMLLVAAAAVLSWRAKTHLPYRWFMVGAALWFLAMLVKEALVPLDGVVFPFIARNVPPAILSGSLYVGLECALCEIGLTLLAVLISPQLGRDADRAIGIGIGAGAFEACFLGAFAAVPVVRALAGSGNVDAVRTRIDSTAQLTTLYWLLPGVERIVAIIGHAATRALVLLGTTHRRPAMILAAFAIFAMGDALVTAFFMSGSAGQVSMWWLELLYLPVALISLPILRWCYANWGRSQFASANKIDVVSIP